MTTDTAVPPHGAEAPDENSPLGALVQRLPGVSELARQLSLGSAHDDPLWQALANVQPDSVEISSYTLARAGQLRPTSTFPGPALYYERALHTITAAPLTEQDVPRGLLLIKANPLDAIKLRAQPVTVDLGSIPTVVEDAAQEVLKDLPWGALCRILTAVRQWLAGAPIVERARLSAIRDPEDAAWTEAVLELRVDVDTTEALRLWEEVATCVDRAKEALTERDREVISRHFGVHVVWEEDDEEG